MTPEEREVVERGSRWRHRKRGSEYTVIGTAQVQADTPLNDYDQVVVYEGDSGLWARPVAEFTTDRFDRLTPEPSADAEQQLSDNFEAVKDSLNKGFKRVILVRSTAARERAEELLAPIVATGLSDASELTAGLPRQVRGAIASALADEMRRSHNEAREAVAQWMLLRSIPTGHGDTLEGLLAEIADFIEERRAAEDRAHRAEFANATITIAAKVAAKRAEAAEAKLAVTEARAEAAEAKAQMWRDLAETADAKDGKWWDEFRALEAKVKELEGDLAAASDAKVEKLLDLLTDPTPKMLADGRDAIAEWLPRGELSKRPKDQWQPAREVWAAMSRAALKETGGTTCASTPAKPVGPS